MSQFIHLPIIVILVGLLASYLIPAVAYLRHRLAGTVSVLIIGVTLVLSFLLTWELFQRGPFTYELGAWPAPWGIELNIDYLGVYMTLVISAMGLLSLLYATKDLYHDMDYKQVGVYYTLYLLLMSSMIGIVLTNDIFNMYVFVEISAITAVAIICVKETKETIEASLKYLILSAFGSALVLMGIALVYMISGHLNITHIAEELSQSYQLYPNVVLAAIALFFVGFGVKSALFPMHVWLPDAHGSAPSPSSAVLSGLVIKVYAVAMLRFFFWVFPRELFHDLPVLELLLWLAALGMILGSMFAIVQEDIKKMLAYSSVAQISYVFLGIGLMSLTGVQGGLLHILNHAITKSLLFLSAGAIIYATGIRKIADMHGIGLRLRVVMICFGLGALAMIGIPGTNGFISKWYLALGALDAGRPFFVVVILVSSLLNSVYYLPVVVNAFFGERGMTKAKEMTVETIPWQMMVPIVVLTLGIILFGLFPIVPLQIVDLAAQMLLEGL